MGSTWWTVAVRLCVVRAAQRYVDIEGVYAGLFTLGDHADFQKSLVILSRLPNPTLFLAVLDKAAPAFFEYGYPALEAACHNIARWPDPQAGQMDLPMACEVITCEPLVRTKVRPHANYR